MTKTEKIVVACVSVAAALLAAFIVVIIVFSVKKNDDDAAWKKVDYIAASSVGELKVGYSDFTDGKTIAIDGQSVKVTRGKAEGENRGHFDYDGKNYYIIIIFDGGKPTGFLYADGGEAPPEPLLPDGYGTKPELIERLDFVAAE